MAFKMIPAFVCMTMLSSCSVSAEEDVDKAKVNIVHFEKMMRDWGYFYYRLAGCRMLSVSEDHELVRSPMAIEGGDWVLYDERGKSGTYGVSHEVWTATKVKLKDPAKYHVDYTQKPIPRAVDAKTLLERYTWIAMLFIDWAHRKEVSPFGNWKDAAALSADYEKEKKTLANDPHLTMYWLLHFGFSVDDRYNEVLQIATAYKLWQQLPEIEWAVDFFKEKDAFYDLQISNQNYSRDYNKEKFKRIFLIRRAYLIWITQSYQFAAEEDALEKWWLSIKVYPYLEPYLIYRIVWLKNNLEKFDKWKAFEALLSESDRNIPLLSYVLASDPHEKNRTEYADIFVRELIDNASLFGGKTEHAFAQAMLLDIADLAQDKEALLGCAKIYFEGNTASKEYKDILRACGRDVPSIEQLDATIKRLRSLGEKMGFDEDKYLSYYEAVKKEIEPLLPDQMAYVIENQTNYYIARLAFYYLFTHNIGGKHEALDTIYKKAGLTDEEEIKTLFAKEYPDLIKNADDPNLKSALKWLEEGQMGSYLFLQNKLNLAHNTIIRLIESKLSRNEKLAAFIYDDLLRDGVSYPLDSLRKSQIEELIEEAGDYISKNHKTQTAGVYSAFRWMEQISDKRAKPFIEEILDNFNHKDIPKIDFNHQDLYTLMRNALKSALVAIEDRKNSAYLEYKDEKSNKFWEVKFGYHSMIIIYGKIGTKGKWLEKNLETQEDAYAEAKKRIAQKLKEGYKKVKR